MKYSIGGEEGGVNRDTHKGVNCGKIQDVRTSNYFIIRQVALLGVLDHCVKKTYSLYP